MQYRLKTIRIYAGEQLVRKYVLDYRNDSVTERSLLASVTEYGNDGTTALPATRFTYPEKTIGFEIDTYAGTRKNFYHERTKSFRVADVNGDGIMDFVYEARSWDIYVLLGTKNSGFQEQAHWGTRLKAYATDYSGYFKMADVNGDGCDDYVYDSGMNSGIRVLLSNCVNGFGDDVEGVYWGRRKYGYAAGSKGFIMADVNGDGRADFVYDPGEQNQVRVLLSTGAEFSPKEDDGPYWTKRKHAYAPNSGGFRMADMNGDGTADFVYDSGQTTGIRILFSNGVNKFDDDTSTYGHGKRVKSYAQESGITGFKLADVNGDGLLDFVYDSGKASSKGVRVLVNLRDFLASDTKWGLREHDYNLKFPGYTLADVNGDGCADFIYDNGGPRVLLSKGSFFFGNDTLWGTREKDYNDNSGGFRIADVNGDGAQDFVYDTGQQGGSNESGVRVLAGKRPFADLLSEVTNKMGGKHQITYEPSSGQERENHYLPYVVQTVSSIRANDCNPTCEGGTVSTTSYTYWGVTNVNYFSLPTTIIIPDSPFLPVAHAGQPEGARRATGG